MVSHVIIGLGGMGGRIIRSLRKIMSKEFSDLNPPRLHLDFLYLDADTTLLDDAPSWSISGTNLQLDNTQIFQLESAEPNMVLARVERYAAGKAWLEKRRSWLESSGAGMLAVRHNRIWDRLLFTLNAETFQARLQEKVRALQMKAGSSAVTFHLLTDLAGSTGSGCLTQMLCLVRHLYNDPENCRVLVYAQLPEKNPPPGRDTGNYHANAYAALLELNALSLGRYTPHDLTGTKEFHQLSDFFTGCYIFGNEDENGLNLDTDEELPELAADFLWLKIVEMDNCSYLSDFENAKNGDDTPETSPDTKLPERGKRFLTFGIKHLIMPKEEDNEADLINALTLQALLQMLYDNWRAAGGYDDKPKFQDFGHIVNKNDQLERWKLSNDHICLSLGILPDDIGDPKWKPILEDWQNIVHKCKGLIRDSKDPKEWFDELGKLCARRFREDFRGAGVKQFYQAKRERIREMAQEIRRSLEAELLEEWGHDDKSLDDIRLFLASLKSATEERLIKMEEIRKRVKSQEEGTEDKVRDSYQEWNKTGVLMKSLGRRDQLFDNHCLILQELYIWRTKLEAWKFAEELLQEFLQELVDFQKEVVQVIESVQQAAEVCRAQYAGRNSEGDYRAGNSHIIQPGLQGDEKRSSDRLMRNEQMQRQQTRSVRARIAARLQDHMTFQALREQFPPDGFIEAVAAACQANLRDILQDREPGDKASGGTIVDTIKERYGTDLKSLRGYLSQQIKHLGNLVIFSEIEKSRKGAGIPETPTCLSKVAVILPTTRDTHFMTILKEAYNYSFEMGGIREAEFIKTNRCIDRITTIKITNLFPLRFLSLLGFLKKKYDEVTGPGFGDRCFELHWEVDRSQFPDLMPPPEAAVASEMKLQVACRGPVRFTAPPEAAVASESPASLLKQPKKVPEMSEK